MSGGADHSPVFLDTYGDHRPGVFDCSFAYGYRPPKWRRSPDMKCPAEAYQPSTRTYNGLPGGLYVYNTFPFHDKTIVVTHCGRICLGRKKINFSTVFAGQAVGIKEVHDDIWLVSFMDYDLG
jgi:hypothetical protein